MLIGILRHWHTTAWGLVIVSLPFMALGLWVGHDALRTTSTKQRIAWLTAVLVWMAFLYLPPMVEQLGPGDGNMARCFSHLSGSAVGGKLQPLVGVRHTSNTIVASNLDGEDRWGSAWPVVTFLSVLVATVAALQQTLRQHLRGETSRWPS
jgi:hypothetical protein